LSYSEITKECPHLAGDVKKYCVAEKAAYPLSTDELREYCSHQQHRMCQFYVESDNSTDDVQ
jgi:hypothetical protein